MGREHARSDSPPSLIVASTSKRTLPRASVACSSCRQKKIKCNGLQPSCSNCLASDTICVIVNTDKRRRKSEVNQVKDLKAQLLELEKSLADARNPADLMVNEFQPVASTSKSAVSGSSNFTLDSTSIAATTSVAVETPLPESEINSFTVDENEELNIGQETPWTVAPGNFTAQVTGRYGRLSIADGGSLRYYGATSSRHISFGGGINPQISSTASLRTKCENILSSLGLLEPLLSPALEERLLRFYFTWHNPFFKIVDEKIFYRHRKLWNQNSSECQFYSPALLYAILSYTAHFSDEVISLLGVSPDTAGDKLMKRAAVLLDAELDAPQVNTVQALAIMAAREAGCGRDARGWTYIGMSIYTAIDLGLNRDSTPWLQANRITGEDASIRNQTWWGVFVYASLWSLYLGRPLATLLGESDTPHPLSEISKFEPWIPIGDLNEIMPATDPVVTLLSDQNLSGHLVLLLQITDSIVRQLYSTQQTLSDSTINLIDWSAEIHSRLVDWKLSLSPALKLSTSNLQPLPHTLILHLQYHSTLILLHRPSLCDPWGKILKDSLAFKICCSSATAVTLLLEQYQMLYSFRRVSVVATHQVFTVATINVFLLYISATVGVTLEEPVLRRSARKGLLVCITALAAIATTQVHARRCYLSIVMLMKKWGISLDEPPTAVKRWGILVDEPTGSYHLPPMPSTFVDSNPSPIPSQSQSQFYSQSQSNFNNSTDVYDSQTLPNPYSLLDQSQRFDRFSRELLALSDDYSFSNTQNTSTAPIDHNTPPSPILVLNPAATTVDPLFFEFDPYFGTAGEPDPFLDWEGPSLFDMFSFPSLD